MKKMFRAGDSVHHKPSGESWTLAADEKDGCVIPFEWPERSVDAKDCVIVAEATDKRRMEILKEWSEDLELSN